jgi:hypothetical protein
MSLKNSRGVARKAARFVKAVLAALLLIIFENNAFKTRSSLNGSSKYNDQPQRRRLHQNQLEQAHPGLAGRRVLHGPQRPPQHHVPRALAASGPKTTSAARKRTVSKPTSPSEAAKIKMRNARLVKLGGHDEANAGSL